MAEGDVALNVEQEQMDYVLRQYASRKERIRSLRARSIRFNPSSSSNSTSNPEHPPLSVSDYMDTVKLYNYAKKNDVDGILNFFSERNETLEELAPRFIYQTIGPLKSTLLHVAAGCDGKETVQLIVDELEIGASILEMVNSKGDTALHVAAKAGKFSTATTLISGCKSDDEGTLREADYDRSRLVRLRNEKGNTALHEALINGHTKLAEALISVDPRVSFYLNQERKSPLYLAAEAGSLKCVTSILDKNDITEENQDEIMKGKSPIRAAILSAAARTETGNILECILHKELRFIHFKDEEGRTALHLAASVGYLEGVRCLLRDYPFDLVQRENNGGLFPIHMAAIGGHVAVIEELLSFCPDPGEMLSRDDQNMLHVAAKIGVSNVVSYVLKTPELHMLLNQRDKDGNTPLHLATMNWHPKIVSVLAKNTRVDLKLVNNESRTALDEAEYLMEAMPSLRKRLTWSALKVAGAPKDPSQNIPDADKHITPPENRITNYYTNRVNNLLLVDTLVITVTFAAGFTMPGGNNESGPDKGMATMLGHRAFRIFIFCDTIAMCSAIIAGVTLIWAQLGDPYLMLLALRLAVPLLGIALIMMALAFTAGVYVVVNKLTWLGIAILVVGLLFLTGISLIFPLFLPLWSSNRILRSLSWYPFNMLVLLTGNYTTFNVEKK